MASNGCSNIGSKPSHFFKNRKEEQRHQADILRLSNRQNRPFAKYILSAKSYIGRPGRESGTHTAARVSKGIVAAKGAFGGRLTATARLDGGPRLLLPTVTYWEAASSHARRHP